jgi:NAD(P)-dependent dehydrogenase (short-subunit alcohol dehydrogenase family)
MTIEVSTAKPVAVVAGAGPGNGASLARRFTAAGFSVALLARHRDTLAPIENELPDAHGFECDVAAANSVTAAFTRIRNELGEVDVLLYNAGSGLFGDVETITPEQFEQSWRVNALGSFLCAQQVIPRMKVKGEGGIIFVGATASRRGGAQSAAFAPAKAAQRSLAESMARKLWPMGIHVALIIIDGAVDLPRIRAAMPDRAADTFVDPAGVAEIAYQLWRQHRQAWSFEVEARPYIEKW